MKNYLFNVNKPCQLHKGIIKFYCRKPRDIKDKDPNANSSLINMNVSFKQPRQFSPALKSIK